MVSAVSPKVFIRFVLVKPVNDKSPVCPDIERLPALVAVPAVRLAAVPVRFVATPEAGVPSAGEAPKLVRLDAVTPLASVDPVKLPAAAGALFVLLFVAATA